VHPGKSANELLVGKVKSYLIMRFLKSSECLLVRSSECLNADEIDL